jgi:hypothetical protein
LRGLFEELGCDAEQVALEGLVCLAVRATPLENDGFGRQIRGELSKSKHGLIYSSLSDELKEKEV